MNLSPESATQRLEAAPPAKVDPETFELRARPARAIRFRRGAIIAAAALGAISLTVIAWMALKPRLDRPLVVDTAMSDPVGKPALDAIADLPSSYSDTPKLGPPLPGDLGRPILRAQEQATGAAMREELDDVETKRQQELAELKAARESGLLVQVTGRGNAPAGSLAAGLASPLPEVAPAAQETPTRKERFASERDLAADLNTHATVPPASPNMLLAGSVIAASLITGLNSDLPGMVTAQVTQNVYDTVSGSILLIPQGARLIGRYDSVVAFGQRRALVVWQRLILPSGASVRLDAMPATDPSGHAGLADKVDYHTWALLKGIGVATMLGVGTELAIDGESDLVEAIREAAQTNTARAGEQITQRNLDIQPTITIRPGAPVRVLVTRDLVIDPIHK